MKIKKSILTISAFGGGVFSLLSLGTPIVVLLSRSLPIYQTTQSFIQTHLVLNNIISQYALYNRIAWGTFAGISVARISWVIFSKEPTYKEIICFGLVGASGAAAYSVSSLLTSHGFNHFGTSYLVNPIYNSITSKFGINTFSLAISNVVVDGIISMVVIIPLVLTLASGGFAVSSLYENNETEIKNFLNAPNSFWSGANLSAAQANSPTVAPTYPQQYNQ